MARIRSIKPEIRISEKVNSWPIEVRYFWIMLWGYVDDHGRGRDNPKLIVADTYPLDDTVDASDVEGYLKVLAKDGVIRRYRVDGGKYLTVVNWAEHQRPSHPARSVIPQIPEGYEDDQEGSGNPPEPLAKTSANGSPEQLAVSRELRAEEQSFCAPANADDAFDEFWSIYPLKKGKDKARAAYRASLRKTDRATILGALRNHLPEWDTKGIQYVPYPATWLNQGRWEDEIVIAGPELTSSEKRIHNNILRAQSWQPSVIPEDVFSRRALGA